MRVPLVVLLSLGLAAAFAAAGCSSGPREQNPGTPSPTTMAPSGEVSLRLLADGFASPLYVTEETPGRLLVLEQKGVVRLVEGGAVRAAPVLDLTDRVGSDSSEQGLLGLALPGGCALGGRFAVLSYTDKAGDSVVSRFSWLADDSGLDAGSEEVLLTLDQPFDNHNGGHVAFGPDCELYVGFGDGGLAGDPNLNGQNKGTWLGDLLRIHVEASGPYTIPAGNPYADGGPGGEKPELWASGLRNPWRFHFDPATGDLWIADVGQNLYEEVNHQPAGVGGLNYGWNLYEGNHHFPSLAPAAAPVPGFTFPVAEYDHTEGRCSVTGGPVYRGADLPGLVGATLFADYCSGTIWRLDGPEADPEVLLEAGFMVSSFGQDSAGEVYVLDYVGGRLLLLG
ncbi:MAG: PQQ-dependent sugar dehydrogenase [Thermoplasmatota archaeon]